VPFTAVPRSQLPDSARHAEVAMRVLERLLRGFVVPTTLRLWDDRVRHLGHGPSAFTLILRDPVLLRRLVTTQDPVLLADAYFRGELDVEGDLYRALALKGHFESMSMPWREKLWLLRDAWQLPRPPRKVGHLARRVRDRLVHALARRHTRAADRQAIAFHYDLSNAFYALWLDPFKVYSCAYFESADDTLDQAQCNKLDLVCRKLRLVPGDRLLDIGCGWGALICWAARRHGVLAHGITLSQRQFEQARERIATEGLGDRVTVSLMDYRDLPAEATYDKVASIGMFEHVGLANLPAYLATVRRVLRPGGLFLNHGITHDEEGWNRTVATRFINRYVFPDGELDCVSNISLGMERSGFEIQDVENLRHHYALTLRHWVRRLEEHRDAALREVDEPTFRTWRLYMVASALEFEAGGTGVYQILASRSGGTARLPLTRRDLYLPDAAAARVRHDGDRQAQR
jgi:cyclopropane-fatty-acyl-phospholipid synthase